MPISETTFNQRLARIAGEGGRAPRSLRPMHRLGARLGRAARLILVLAVFGFGAKVGAMAMMGTARYEGKAADLAALLPEAAASLAPILRPDAASLWLVDHVRGVAQMI